MLSEENQGFALKNLKDTGLVMLARQTEKNESGTKQPFVRASYGDGIFQQEYMCKVILAERAQETSTCSLHPATSVQVLIAGTVGSYMFRKVISTLMSELQQMEKGQKHSTILCICPRMCGQICYYFYLDTCCNNKIKQKYKSITNQTVDAVSKYHITWVYVTNVQTQTRGAPVLCRSKLYGFSVTGCDACYAVAQVLKGQ